MDAVIAGGKHPISGPASADFTYTKYWQTLMTADEHKGQTLQADDFHEPVPSLKSPTPTPPPSRCMPPKRQKSAAVTVSPRTPPSHLTEAGTYRLNLALKPSPHQAKRSSLPQYQEPLPTMEMTEHVGERKRGKQITRAMGSGNNVSPFAEEWMRKPSSERKSPSSALHTADHLSDEDAGAVRTTGSAREQLARDAVIGGTCPVGSAFSVQQGSSASGDKDLVDSPRQQSSAAEQNAAQHAFSLTAGAAPLDAVYTYTPDDLVVKAAECYEQWRQDVLEGGIDTDDNNLVWEYQFTNEGGASAWEDEASDAMHRTSRLDGPARAKVELAGTAVPSYAHTPTDDRRGVPDSEWCRVSPDAKALLSPASARGKQTPFRGDGTHSHMHSAETATHGLTSGRRDRDGDIDSAIKAAGALPSLFTWMSASPVAKSPSPHVAPAVPILFSNFRAHHEKVTEQLTVETEVERTVEESGARSQGASRPSQQHRHEQPVIQMQHGLHQRTERIPEIATRISRPKPINETYMSENVCIVDDASVSIQSPPVSEEDMDDAQKATPLSFVYRRLFSDEVEDCGGEVTTWYNVTDAHHHKTGGATNTDGVLSLCTPSGKQGQERSVSGPFDVLADCQSEVTKMMSGDASHDLAALAVVDHVRETLIELSSCGSSSEDCGDPVDAAKLSETGIASHTEANLHRCTNSFSDGPASLHGDPSSLVLNSASQLSSPPSMWPLVDSGKGNGLDQAEITDSEAQVAPAVAPRPLLYRDHPLWCKHHLTVSMLYASRLLPSEQANDELQLFLCWAQEKAERQSRMRQHRYNSDTHRSSDTVLERSELGASPHVSCAASEVYKVAYAMARRGKWVGAPLSHVQQDSFSGEGKQDATGGASLVGFASSQATSPSCQQTPPLPHPAVFVAPPLQSSDVAWSSPPAEDVHWTLTPAAAPSRFVEWIATEVDPYESLLFSPL
ncbi:hypothetical protein, conserved [Leishmania tarentolae]|uniref:Uncharacterized protein n=1 Tax=Leishmania tarentolae TaxID=5689 RepID=A0A640KFP9_LEITA|nr:hypothetical protein, conserved [Leishmania tarentolae]